MVYHVILMPEEFLEQVKSSSTLGSLQIQRLIWIIPLLMARLKVHGLSFGSADYTWLILKLIQTCLINVTFNLKHFITSDTELHIRIVKKIFLSYTCFILEVQISIVICQKIEIYLKKHSYPINKFYVKFLLIYRDNFFFLLFLHLVLSLQYWI